MTKTSKTDWSRLARQDDQAIDTSDIPELDEKFFREAELRAPAKQTETALTSPNGLHISPRGAN